MITDGARSVNLTEFEEAVKHRTVFAHIEPLQLTDIVLHVVYKCRVGNHCLHFEHDKMMMLAWSDEAEEVDVIVRMETSQLGCRNNPWSENIHLSVEPVVDNQIVSHPNSVWLYIRHGISGGQRGGCDSHFHWMALTIVKVSNLCVIEICNSPLRGSMGILQ